MVVRRERDAGGRVLVVTRQRYGARRLWEELARAGATGGRAGAGVACGGRASGGVPAGNAVAAVADHDADGRLLR